MAFGLDTGISRNTTHTAQVAEKIGSDGTIQDMTTHGSAAEIVEETYIDAESFTNEAVNGQTGTEVVTNHGLIESNTEYARTTKTTREAGPAGS